MTISDDQLSKEWNFVKYRFQLHFIRDEKVSLSLCFTLKINKMQRACIIIFLSKQFRFVSCHLYSLTNKKKVNYSSYFNN